MGPPFPHTNLYRLQVTDIANKKKRMLKSFDLFHLIYFILSKRLSCSKCNFNKMKQAYATA